MSAGLFALAGLVFSGLYPGSMVGVPGAQMSNIAPPTLVIVALLSFQIGVVEVARPMMASFLRWPLVARINAVVNRIALPLFLCHTTGLAIVKAVQYGVISGGIVNDRAPDLVWWLQRPLVVAASLLVTAPIIVVLMRRTGRLRAGQQ